MHYLYENSDRCQPCVRCMEGVRNSEGPLWEVPLCTVYTNTVMYLTPPTSIFADYAYFCGWCMYDYVENELLTDHREEVSAFP